MRQNEAWSALHFLPLERDLSNGRGPGVGTLNGAPAAARSAGGPSGPGEPPAPSEPPARPVAGRPTGPTDRVCLFRRISSRNPTRQAPGPRSNPATRTPSPGAHLRPSVWPLLGRSAAASSRQDGSARARVAGPAPTVPRTLAGAAGAGPIVSCGTPAIRSAPLASSLPADRCSRVLGADA